MQIVFSFIAHIFFFSGRHATLLLALSVGPTFRHIPELRAFFVACYATLHPALLVHLSIHPSIRQSVSPSFFGGFGYFWTCCYCPKTHMTTAHPHTTGLAMYLALFCITAPAQPSATVVLCIRSQLIPPLIPSFRYFFLSFSLFLSFSYFYLVADTWNDCFFRPLVLWSIAPLQSS